MATDGIPITVSSNSEHIALSISESYPSRSVSVTTDSSAPVSVSSNARNIALNASSDDTSLEFSGEDRNPYYVGARAYVEQLENGARITIIDKEGTTTATVYSGGGGRITDVTMNGVSVVDENGVAAINHYAAQIVRW